LGKLLRASYEVGNVGIIYDSIWNIIWPFDIKCALWYMQFVAIWYIFPILVCLDQEKSGNPDWPDAPAKILLCMYIVTIAKKETVNPGSVLGSRNIFARNFFAKINIGKILAILSFAAVVS
jgi:hypothetical protein